MSYSHNLQLDDAMISILLFADDIVLITPSARKLQTVLNIFGFMVQKWRLTVNPDKTKVIHFRTSSVTRSNFAFKYGEKHLEYVPTYNYKYWGIWINEHLNMNKTASELAKSAGWALSVLHTKCLRAGGMTWMFLKSCMKHLRSQSCATPVASEKFRPVSAE